MGDPFLTEELPDIWSKFTYAGSYEKEYKKLRSLVMSGADSDCAGDFDIWQWLFNSCVFDGQGANPGLTEICTSLLTNLTRTVETGNKAQVDNWHYRLRHLLPHHYYDCVPALRPLVEILIVLNGARLIVSSQPEIASKIIKAGSAKLKEQWESGGQRLVEKLLPTLLDGDGVLIIGHSKVVKRAIDAAIAGGIRLKGLFLFCPGPLRQNKDAADNPVPVGRNPAKCKCLCPFIPPVQTKSPAQPLCSFKEVADRISLGKINKVLCAACAYTQDRSTIWITKGGAAVADAVRKTCLQGKKATFFPIAGDYKQLAMEPEDRILTGTSGLVDRVGAADCGVDTRCLA